MRNILLITSLYPCDDVKILNNTAVCHYFAKEWVKLGYNVRVFFNYNVYPRYYYPFLHLMRYYLANVAGVSIQDVFLKKDLTYVKDGIKITQAPICKRKPGGRFTQKEIQRQAEKIEAYLSEENFVPDYILGHFIHPNLELVSVLKDYYHHAIGTISLHGPEKERFEEDAALFNRMDFIGFRSYPTRWAFERLYGVRPFFMCPSGVPEAYIKDPRSFQSGISKYIYVGTLMNRKYPASLVPAISEVYGTDNYSITYVGDGDGKRAVDKEINKARCADKVYFTGRIPRDQVTRHLDEAEVFIMISKIETFGLVYLEAMARGCIVVASRNEGMDGIIEDGVNGFLCEAGNVEELKSIVSKIKNMALAKLNEISFQGIATARRYTDSKVAKEYIEAIVKQ